MTNAFGCTDADYDRMLEAQGGGCAICQRKPRRKRLCWDHEHRTGLVRGLLCDDCNYNLLGKFHEDARLFTRAAGYLDHPPALNVFRPPKRHRDAPPIRHEQSVALSHGARLGFTTTTEGTD